MTRPKNTPHGPTRRQRRWRWPLTFLSALVGILALFVLPLACTTTIITPAELKEPVTVYLLDHGHAPSLVLPSGDGGMVRYVYGDWNYYALRHRKLTDGLAALLWPTQGALGRKALDRPADTENLRRQIRIGIENLYALQVERQAVERLRARLERIFHDRSDTQVTNRWEDLEFVHHPKRYTYLNNSNRVTAHWLRELGCQIRGPALTSRWRISPGSKRRGTRRAVRRSSRWDQAVALSLRWGLVCSLRNKPWGL